MTIRPRTSLEENNSLPLNASSLPSSPEKIVKKICPSSSEEDALLSQEVQQQGLRGISLLQRVNSSLVPLDPPKYTHSSLSQDLASTDKISSSMKIFKLPLDHRMFNPHLSLKEIEKISQEDWIKALQDHPGQGVLYCHLVHKLDSQGTITLLSGECLKKEDLILKAIKCGNSIFNLQILYENPSLLNDPCFDSFLEKLSHSTLSSEIKLQNYQSIFTNLLIHSKTCNMYSHVKKLLSLIQKERPITSSCLNEEESFEKSEKMYEELLKSINIYQNSLPKEEFELALQKFLFEPNSLKDQELYPYFVKLIFDKGKSKAIGHPIKLHASLIKWLFSLMSKTIFDEPYSSRPYALLADCLRMYQSNLNHNEHNLGVLFYLTSIHLNSSQFAAYYGLLDFYCSHRIQFTRFMLPKEYAPSSPEYILTLIDQTSLSYEALLTKVIQFMPLTFHPLSVYDMNQLSIITLNQCIEKFCQIEGNFSSLVQLLNTIDSFSCKKGYVIYQSLLRIALLELLSRRSSPDLIIEKIEALLPSLKYPQQNSSLSSFTDDSTHYPFSQMTCPQSSLDDLCLVPLETWIETLQKNPSNPHFYCNLARFCLENDLQDVFQGNTRATEAKTLLQYQDFFDVQSRFSLSLLREFHCNTHSQDIHTIRVHEQLNSTPAESTTRAAIYQKALINLHRSQKELFPHFILSLYFRALEQDPLNSYAYHDLANALQNMYPSHPSLIQGVTHLLHIIALGIDPEDVDNILAVANTSHHEVLHQILEKYSLNQQQLFKKGLARELFYLMDKGNLPHLAVRQKGDMKDQSVIYQKIVHSYLSNQSCSYETIEENIPRLIQKISALFPQSTLYFKLSSEKFPYLQYDSNQSQFCVSFYELDDLSGLFQQIPHQSHRPNIKKIKNFIHLENRAISRNFLGSQLIEKSVLPRHVKLEIYEAMYKAYDYKELTWADNFYDEMDQSHHEDEDSDDFIDEIAQNDTDILYAYQLEILLKGRIGERAGPHPYQYPIHNFIPIKYSWDEQGSRYFYREGEDQEILTMDTVQKKILDICSRRRSLSTSSRYSSLCITFADLLSSNESIKSPWSDDPNTTVTKKDIYIQALQFSINHYSRYGYFKDNPSLRAVLYTKIADLLEPNETLQIVSEEEDVNDLDTPYVTVQASLYHFLPPLKALTSLDLYIEALILDPTLKEAFLGLERLSFPSYSFQTNGFPSKEEIYDKTIQLLQTPLDLEVEKSGEIRSYVLFKKQAQEMRDFNRSLQIKSYTLSSLKPLYLDLIERSSNSPYPYYFLAGQIQEGEQIQLLNGVWLSKKELYQRAVQLEIDHAHAYYRLANQLSPRQGVLLFDGKTILSKFDLFMAAFMLDLTSSFYLKELVGFLKSLEIKKDLLEKMPSR
ncbi:MAG: hypothetical protein QRY71_03175 [Candidatus Rhabdochlamydia sp.]